MLIGSDYPKIELSLFCLDLMEPNAMLGDLVLCFLSLFFAFKVSRIPIKSTFFIAWKWFFVLFGVGFFWGGLGHLMYNYWGVAGKYPSWYLGIISVFFVERAMISIHPSERFVRALNLIVFIKLTLAIITATAVFVLLDIKTDTSVGLRVPSFNSAVGLFFSLGCLAVFYYKTISPVFILFLISAFVLVPAGFFQLMKINFHQWFDKNDASHLLLIASLFLYFCGVKAYQKHLLYNC
jgi:hypothetical protein